MFEDNVKETLPTGPLLKAMENNGIISVSVDSNLTSFEQQLILSAMPPIIEKIGVNNVKTIILNRGGTATIVVDNEPTQPVKGLMGPVIAKLLSHVD